MHYKSLLMKLSQIGRKHIWFRKCLLLCSDLYYSSLTHLSDEAFAQRIFSKYSRKKLDLSNPQTFNEKLWWLKLNYRSQQMPVCSDKYTVRGYVEACGLDETLIPLVGVYDTFESLPFNDFREPIFIKCTKGSGGNVIYDPAKEFDYKTQRMLFNHKLKTDYTRYSREWNYGGTPNRIVCEKVIRTNNGCLPVDYKFMCFGGEPRLLFFSENVASSDGQHNVSGSRFVNVYDTYSLELLPIETSIPSNRRYILEKPTNYDAMLVIVRKLAEPFPFCRVDLYNVDGKVYFGEITFFPSGGNDIIKPEEWSLRMGNWIDISAIKDREYEH